MSEVYLEIEGTYISGYPIEGRNNKFIITPDMAWFWPFEWKNLNNYLEHYKVETELLSLGVREEDMVTGYQENDDVRLFDVRENPPNWVKASTEKHFKNKNIYYNNIPF